MIADADASSHAKELAIKWEAKKEYEHTVSQMWIANHPELQQSRWHAYLPDGWYGIIIKFKDLAILSAI